MSSISASCLTDSTSSKNASIPFASSGTGNSIVIVSSSIGKSNPSSSDSSLPNNISS